MNTRSQTQCFHCGEPCTGHTTRLGDKIFCCAGCRSVYSILDNSGLCAYYRFNPNAGNTLASPVKKDKYDFLTDPKIEQQLLNYRDDSGTQASFYIPQIHCSSCLYLLENLHRVNAGVISCNINFPKKQATIHFNHHELPLNELVALLAALGYEPYISLSDLDKKKPPAAKKILYQLGVAGFCFGNIMLLSFPEYLGLQGDDPLLKDAFHYIALVLALPVLLFSAQPFFMAAWKSIRQGLFSIDVPVALAIALTFGRSVYELYAGTSGGYFDSMTGIVFFMLAGRVLQQKTYRALSFERDYTAYFPVSVTRISNGEASPVSLPGVKVNDTLRIHHGELIAADGILTRGKAMIDYSFVTGESMPVTKEMGEIVYAGGRQTGSSIEILTIKEVAQSYLTALWDKSAPGKKEMPEKDLVNVLNRYFSGIVLLLAVGGAAYWSFYDTYRSWNVLTTVLIVACPCALLLSSSFTNANIMRILARNKLYLRNAATIEKIAATDHIIFDKTGTLTGSGQQALQFIGAPLSQKNRHLVAALAAQSLHPLSKAIALHLGADDRYQVKGFAEEPGKGIEGFVNGELVQLGAPPVSVQQAVTTHGTQVHVSVENRYLGYFNFHQHFRDSLEGMLNGLFNRFRLSVLSGDTGHEEPKLHKIFKHQAKLLFRQQPHDKMNYIRQLQESGERVMMIGDGLNDAAALQQADTGIAVSEGNHYFTPASDAILDAESLKLLPRFIALCKANSRIILASFVLSLLYNIAGLYFALQGILMPLAAAILMPASSLSILLLTYGSSSLVARKLRLSGMDTGNGLRD